MSDISMLMTGDIKNIPISEAESIILKSAIQHSIDYRLNNKISMENGEDIILLKHTLETLNKNFK